MEMKNTLFFDELSTDFPVPLLALEYYAVHMSVDMDDETLIGVLTDTLRLTCGIDEPSGAHIEYFLKRLQKLNEVEAKETAQRPTSRSLGTAFFEQINQMDTIQLLGRMTHYSLPAMRELYCKADFEHTRNLMTSYVEGLRGQLLADFESVMYGMGNSYKGDNGQSGNVMDANSKEGMAMMRKFGVGSINFDDFEASLARVSDAAKSPGPEGHA